MSYLELLKLAAPEAIVVVTALAVLTIGLTTARALVLGPIVAVLGVALAIREPTIVAYLVDVFERAWERARPFTNTERSMMNDIALEQRAMTIRMLIEGHSDPVSAKRLGVSARTFAGYVADLKEEYDSETRFQLGYTMGQAGVSGREDG